jgi:hypothetical protein
MKIAPFWIVLLTVGCSGSTPTVSGNGGAIAVGGSAGFGGGSTFGGTRATDTEASVTDASAGGSSSGVRACQSTNQSSNNLACHSVADCTQLPPVKCCTSGDCWGASACPLSPMGCPNASTRLLCTTNQDCADGGTCVSAVTGCPQCEYRNCQYPPPACTQSPDSCGNAEHCQSNGSCTPILCTEGFACPNESHCSIGSSRADGHGCELIPCNQGWTCAENTRCTAPDDPNHHGCTVMSCKLDTDCDCGFCVNGSCAANLGTCTQAPQ